MEGNKSLPEHVVTLIEKWGLLVPMYDEKADILSGLTSLITTTAILHNVVDGGYDERYCFKTRERAILELLKWCERGFNDQRPTGWVACRSVSGQDMFQSMETYHGPGYAENTLRWLEWLEKSNARIEGSEYPPGACFIPGSVKAREFCNRTGKEMDDLSHEVAYLRLIKKAV